MAEPTANSAELVGSHPIMSEAASLSRAHTRFLEIEHQGKRQRVLHQRAYEKIWPLGRVMLKILSHEGKAMAQRVARLSYSERA